MNIKLWLDEARQKLIDAGVETARLDAEVLLSDVLGKNRAWLLAHPEYIIPGTDLRKVNKWMERRLKHEPISYIVGHKEFYGREFYVDKTVLVPRPESEQIIEEFLRLDLPKNAVVADVGCGSGALGITARLEKNDILINLLDISEKVFPIAKRNVRKHKIRAQYYIGDLLEAWPIIYDLLLCNLPYVPKNYPVNKAAQHEPNIALFSGTDGLDHYRKLFKQLATLRIGDPMVITESLPEQHVKLRDIAKNAGYKQVIENDLIQVFSRPTTL